MDFDAFVSRLREEPQSAHIELAGEKEAAYMIEHARRFKRYLSAIPSSAESLRILDIGTTPFTLFLKHAFPHYDVCTIDRTNLLGERCRAAEVDARCCDLSREPMPFEEGTFNVVIFTEVLEHLFGPPTDILRKIRRALKPSGKLILSVPNIARLASRLKLLAGRTVLEDPDVCMSGSWVHGHGHVHEYTRDEIIEICRRAGLTVLSSEMISVDPRDVLRQPGRVNLTRLAYHCVAWLVPGFRFTILVECQKSEKEAPIAAPARLWEPKNRCQARLI